MMNVVSPLSDHVCGDCTCPSQTDSLIISTCRFFSPSLGQLGSWCWYYSYLQTSTAIYDFDPTGIWVRGSKFWHGHPLATLRIQTSWWANTCTIKCRSTMTNTVWFDYLKKTTWSLLLSRNLTVQNTRWLIYHGEQEHRIVNSTLWINISLGSLMARHFSSFGFADCNRQSWKFFHPVTCS